MDSGEGAAVSVVFLPRLLFRFAPESASVVMLLSFHQHSRLRNSSRKTRFLAAYINGFIVLLKYKRNRTQC